MAELIQKTDNLNQGRIKINEAIIDTEKALKISEQAITVSDKARESSVNAENTAISVQQQLDTLIIDSGTSDAEVIQARGGEPLLKDRLDKSDEKVDDITNTVGEQLDAKLSDQTVWEDLAQRTVNLSWFEHLIPAKNVITDPKEWDWSIPLQTAIDNYQNVFIPKREHLLTTDITPSSKTMLIGVGVYDSILKAQGSITVINWSSDTEKVGAGIFQVGIIGDGTPGQVGIDAKYFVNNSSISDVRIENCDKGFRLTKSWYSSIARIYAKNNNTVAAEIIFPTAIEQVNAVTFSGLYLMGSINNLILKGPVSSCAVRFESCTFEASKKTSVIVENVSPLVFDNCYFEKNYTDATSFEVLTWDKPIDVKINTQSTRNTVSIKNCYFSRRDNFVESNQKTSIYLGDNVQYTGDNNQFQCNKSSYIDANIYSVSIHVPFLRATGEDGYAKQNYIGIMREYPVANLMDANIRYSSTSKIQFIPVERGSYFLKFIPDATGTISSAPSLRVRNRVSNAVITTANFPTSYKAGEVIERSIGSYSSPSILVVEFTVTPSDDLLGSLYIVRKDTR